MENLKLLNSIAVALLVGVAIPIPVAAADGATSSTAFQLASASVAGEFSSTLQASTVDRHGLRQSQLVPSAQPIGAVQCGYWSTWHNLGYYTDGSFFGFKGPGTFWGVDLRDSCVGNQQVFPNGPLACMTFQQWINRNNQNPNLGPLHKYAFCYFFPPGQVPAGLGMSSQCNSSAEASSYLSVVLTPSNYDPKSPSQLQLSTQFLNGFNQGLSDGTCTSAVNWDVTGWTVQWPDGQIQNYPGSGQQPLDASYTTLPNQPGTGQAIATAHIHVHGIFQDFDPSGNLFLNQGDANLDVTNSTAAKAAQYVPPVMQIAAVGEGQHTDGTFSPPLGALPSIHVDTTYGRLLELFPKPIVVTPGYEVIAGVNQGQATSTEVSWTFLGPATDTPPSETTWPGTTLPTGSFLYVQYNHAEPLSPTGHPQDETVRFSETVQSTYPDGTVRTDTVTGTIAITIFYAGLNFTG